MPSKHFSNLMNSDVEHRHTSGAGSRHLNGVIAFVLLMHVLGKGRRVDLAFRLFFGIDL